MKLKDGMLLFHGSYTAVESIDLDQCMKGKDFGKGFYLTSDPNQAKSFIRSSLIKAQNTGRASVTQNYGYVSSFRYHEPAKEILVHEFNNADKEWLWFISQNRRKRLAEELIPLINDSIMNAEIVIGKIANDTTNPVITAYLNGLYGDVRSEKAVNFAIEQLLPDHLSDQYCFLSEDAICCLEFQEARKYVI
ncbi:DUF3990 domain-containing protein [Oribacterium sp. WCC10]|jgi:hypothetical protein|uniref:DUF3990 domain-containing protein n=1 Tax=Oribacterium sp. WCC10 TaxID=1855343 RepID=UPI0008EFDB98|nr:DUF3990 domain-containing protein [Oribacterium sp. WCC10]SFG75944.1 Protein of unknown function [Oribacterium sp. WCC10]